MHGRRGLIYCAFLCIRPNKKRRRTYEKKIMYGSGLMTAAVLAATGCAGKGQDTGSAADQGNVKSSQAETGGALQGIQAWIPPDS